MRKNTVRERLEADQTALNGWLHCPSSVSAELMAHAGYHSLTLDLQHGLMGYADALSMLQAISTTATVPLCRISWLEPGMIMRLLDAGAYGLICPMVNTAQDARAFVEAARYPPLGQRSYGPTRVRLYAGEDYPQHANAEILTFAMIETEQALSNLDSILAVNGLDGVYVGPADLGLSLEGEIKLDTRQGLTYQAILEIALKTRARGKFAGIHTLSPAYAQHVQTLGYRFISVASDLGLLSQAAKKSVQDTLENVDSVQSKPGY